MTEATDAHLEGVSGVVLFRKETWKSSPHSKLGHSLLQTLIFRCTPSPLVDILRYFAPPLSTVFVGSPGKLGGNIVPVFKTSAKHYSIISHQENLHPPLIHVKLTLIPQDTIFCFSPADWHTLLGGHDCCASIDNISVAAERSRFE